MKKLMIVAAALASTVAFADCEIAQSANCAEVYDVVLNLKTTICKCSSNKVKSSECGIVTSQQGPCVAWRQVASKKVQGVVFSCYCSCTEDVDNKQVLVQNPVIWNELTGGTMEGNQYFWIAKDKIVLPADDLLTIKWLARIGKSKNQVEAAGTFGEGIYVAGYGAFDTKNGHVKNISGNAAGVWGGPIDCSDETATEICPAYDPCDPNTAVDDFTKTFAAGTWTVKYNASKSKALGRNAANLWGKVVPKAVANYGDAYWYQSIAL